MCVVVVVVVEPNNGGHERETSAATRHQHVKWRTDAAHRVRTTQKSPSHEIHLS